MKLGEVIAGWRYSERLTLREAALIMGVSHTTLFRLERCKGIDGKTLATVIAWLMGAWTGPVPK